MLLYNQTGKGTYWRALGLGQALAKRGHDITLVSISPNEHFRFRTKREGQLTLVESPDLLPWALRSGWDLYDVLARMQWLRGKAFDVVHLFESRPVCIIPGLWLRQHTRCRLVIDWCDWFGRGGSVEERTNAIVRNLLRPIETFFEERFRTRADGATVINSTLWQKLVLLGMSPERIRLMPNGADSVSFAPGTRTQMRQELCIRDDEWVIAYTGAIFYRDAELLAATFNEISARCSQAYLLLLGYFSVPLERMVAAPHRVIRTGPVMRSLLLNYLHASDIGLLPLSDTGANRGRMPMKLMDYMAAGLPIVATDVGDVGRLVCSEQIGRVVPDDPAALAGAVIDLMQNDIERARLGCRARSLAVRRFSWDLIASDIEQFYSELLESHPENLEPKFRPQN